MDLLKDWEKQDFGIFVLSVGGIMLLNFAIAIFYKKYQHRKLTRLGIPFKS